MGTNYYLRSKPCPCCGHSKEERHIGKSSFGWCFALHVYPADGIENWEKWQTLIEGEGVVIVNEYEESVPAKFMVEIITERMRETPSQMTPDQLRANQAEYGPNHLLRRRVDGRYCIGHGEGTYDYIVGDFS